MSIKPYYQDDYVTIYNGDCREVLPELPMVDLVLTDPPYEIPATSCGFEGGRIYLDTIRNAKLHEGFDFALLEVFDAKLKTTNLITFCNKAQFSGYLDWIKAHNYNWQLLTWHKPGCIPLRKHYASDTEYAFHIWRQLPIRNGGKSKTYFIHNVNRNGFDHPTVKPESIISKMIVNTTDKGQFILDPFLGSGTTAYCAKKLGRHAIGIEISEKYCEIAARRCSQSFMELNVTDNSRLCYVCNQPINGKRADSDYCSDRCRQKAYRNRRNASVTDKVTASA